MASASSDWASVATVPLMARLRLARSWVSGTVTSASDLRVPSPWAAATLRASGPSPPSHGGDGPRIEAADRGGACECGANAARQRVAQIDFLVVPAAPKPTELMHEIESCELRSLARVRGSPLKRCPNGKGQTIFRFLHTAGCGLVYASMSVAFDSIMFAQVRLMESTLKLSRP